MNDHVQYQQIHEIPGLVLSDAVFSEYAFDRHFHLDLHIGLVSEGIQRQHVNGDTFFLAPGRISVMPPGEVHDGMPDGGAAYALRTFRLSSDLQDALVQELTQSDRAPWLGGTMLDNPTLACYLLRMHDSMGRAASISSLAVHSEWLTLIDRLFSQAPRFAPRPAGGTLSPRQWHRVYDYCRANLGEKITLEQLSTLCGQNRFQFLRLFKQTVGMTPHAWLLRLRLEQACFLLGRNRLSLTEIAHRVGFYDQSHFNRAFRLAFGVPPSHYTSPIPHR